MLRLTSVNKKRWQGVRVIATVWLRWPLCEVISDRLDRTCERVAAMREVKVSLTRDRRGSQISWGRAAFWLPSCHATVTNSISAYKNYYRTHHNVSCEQGVQIRNFLKYLLLWLGSLYCVVGIATRLRAGWSGVRIPLRVKRFYLLQKFQTGCGAHQSSYSTGIGVLSQV